MLRNRITADRIAASVALVLIVVCLWVQPASAQFFDSGSTEVDGALLLETPGVVLFDPADFDPPLDPDGDGVYHFTTITIAEGVTVKLRADLLGTRPVVWLANGDVDVAGVIDLNGEDGHKDGEARLTAVPGAGGFYGGLGGTTLLSATSGQGPGGGGHGVSGGSGGGASFGTVGRASGPPHGSAGAVYGNKFLWPLIGGSGGGGGSGFRTVPSGGGGGAGGGSLLLASSGTITVDGAIEANGGGGGIAGIAGGGGSGGGLRLMARTLEGSGSISAAGGAGGFVNGSNAGGNGRVRIEAFEYAFHGNPDQNTSFSEHLGPVFPRPETTFSVRLTRIAGVDVPAAPVGSFDPADLVLETTGEVPLEIAAQNVPLGTVVRLTLSAESGEQIAIESTPLAGTLESSTATAAAVIPLGFSRFTILASWTP